MYPYALYDFKTVCYYQLMDTPKRLPIHSSTAAMTNHLIRINKICPVTCPHGSLSTYFAVISFACIRKKIPIFQQLIFFLNTESESSRHI